MSSFEQIRVRLLTAVAVILALALGVHFIGGGNSSPTSSLWRFVSRSADEPVPTGRGGDLPAASGSSSILPPPKSEIPNAVDQSIYFNGGDVPDSELAPTPTNTQTPTPSSSEEGEVREVAKEEEKQARIVPSASPTIQATLAPEEQMLGGVAVVRGAPVSATPQGIVGSALPWVSGQARGYTMLYALQPEAQAVTESNISALLSARLREPHIGILIDGTFGRDYEYLKDIIRRLNGDGRRLTLALYLSNGATQRKWRTTPINAPFVRINPEDFRQDIRRNVEIRAQYSEIAANARRIFDYNLSLNSGAKNFAVVMLEDNLDRESFRAMAQLANEQLNGVATIVRNPCESCGVSGTDGDTLGYAREEHSASGFLKLQRGDGFTLDGTGFSYPTEPQSTAVNPQQLTSLIVDGYQKGLSYFGLWRAGWQGVSSDGQNLAPNARSYSVPTADEMEFEVTALREGLPLEDVSDQDLSESEGQSDGM